MLEPAAPPPVVAITTTVGSMEDANRLAKLIVDRTLAACVQLDSIAASIYRWEGKVCAEPEVRLTIKTVTPQVEHLRRFFEEEHPYELPQFVVSRVEVSREYGLWVVENSGAGV
jgi:periplasmic divalent cation tolerance protein